MTIESKIKRFMKLENTAIKMFLYGILLQIGGYCALFIIAILLPEIPAISEMKTPVIGKMIDISILIFWCIPLLSVLGLFSGFSYIASRGFSALSLLGILLNTIWLLTFLLSSLSFSSDVSI